MSGTLFSRNLKAMKKKDIFCILGGKDERFGASSGEKGQHRGRKEREVPPNTGTLKKRREEQRNVANLFLVSKKKGEEGRHHPPGGKGGSLNNLGGRDRVLPSFKRSCREKDDFACGGGRDTNLSSFIFTKIL